MVKKVGKAPRLNDRPATNGRISKHQFIADRSGMAPAVLIAEAAVQGVTIRPHDVWATRLRLRELEPASRIWVAGSRGTSIPSAAEKREFVRAHPHKTAGQVSAAAARAGWPISVGRVYGIRRELRSSTRAAGKKVQRRRPRDDSRWEFVAARMALTVDQVLAEGSRHEISLDRQYIWKVRNLQRGRLAAQQARGAARPIALTPEQKAAFVRGLPASLPASVVVRRAAEAGWILSEASVYYYRARDHRGRVTSRPTAAQKRAFVQALPTHLPASDVVRRAAEAGWSINPSAVYYLRRAHPRPPRVR